MTTLEANADLLKRQRELISRKDLKPFTKRKDGPGLIYLSVHLTCIGLSGLLIYIAANSNWLWPAMLLHGILLGHLFAPLHETSHGTAFRTRWINEAVLWFTGVVIIWPPIYFRYDHAGHHTYAQNKGKDPEFVLPSPRTLLGYIYYVSAVHLWIKNFGWLFRHAFGYMHPFNRQFVPDVERPRIYFEARLMLALYLGLLIFSLVAQTWVVAIYWFIPTMIGVPIARMVRVADHTGCVEKTDLVNYARTVKTDPITRFFCWNMPYHCEHHLAASAPFHQLPALHEAVGHKMNPVDKGYVAVQWEVLTQHLSAIIWPKADGQALEK